MQGLRLKNNNNNTQSDPPPAPRTASRTGDLRPSIDLVVSRRSVQWSLGRRMHGEYTLSDAAGAIAPRSRM